MLWTFSRLLELFADDFELCWFISSTGSDGRRARLAVDYFYTMLESLTGGDLFDFFRLLMSDDLKPDHVEREVRVVPAQTQTFKNFLRFLLIRS